MAIDIEFVSKFIKTVCFSYIGNTFRSTLWTAILIVVVILVIVIVLYPKGKNIPIGSYIKPVLYTFLSTLLLLFIHDSCLQDENKMSRENESAENVIGGIKMFRGKESSTGGVYEAVYGKEDNSELLSDDVKTRTHESVGHNSYVSSAENNRFQKVEPQKQKSPHSDQSDRSEKNSDSVGGSDDGKIVNISQEV